MGRYDKKRKIVEEIKQDLSEAKTIVLTDYRGLTVAQMNRLRGILKEQDVKYRVVKNTLARFAVQEAGYTEIDPYLTGPVAIAFGYDDPVVPVKLLVDFSKENDELNLKGGILDRSNFLDENKLVEIAKLPPKEVLLGQVAGSLQSPISAFLTVLQGNLRNLVYALQAVKEQKESA